MAHRLVLVRRWMALLWMVMVVVGAVVVDIPKPHAVLSQSVPAAASVGATTLPHAGARRQRRPPPPLAWMSLSKQATTKTTWGTKCSIGGGRKEAVTAAAPVRQQRQFLLFVVGRQRQQQQQQHRRPGLTVTPNDNDTTNETEDKEDHDNYNDEDGKETLDDKANQPLQEEDAPLMATSTVRMDDGGSNLTDRFKYKVNALMGVFDPPPSVVDNERQEGTIYQAVVSFPTLFTFVVVGRTRGDVSREEAYLAQVRNILLQSPVQSKRRGRNFLRVSGQVMVESAAMISHIYQQLEALNDTVMKF